MCRSPVDRWSRLPVARFLCKGCFVDIASGDALPSAAGNCGAAACSGDASAGGLIGGCRRAAVAAERPAASEPPADPERHQHADGHEWRGRGAGRQRFRAGRHNPFDPVLDGYPAGNPTTGFTPKDEGFAGIIFGQPTDGSATLQLYCFDLFTDTWPGIGYALGTWDAATVPNVGYVARILSEYYPFDPTLPEGLASTTEQAAAVQAAIWFFSDRYVLNTSDPLHATVAAIVAHIISEGPLPAPGPPVSDHPDERQRAEHERGRRAVHGDLGIGSATVTATGGNMFSDAAGTVPIANGSSVPSGTQVFLRSTGTTISGAASHGGCHCAEAKRLPLRRQHARCQRRAAADPRP